MKCAAWVPPAVPRRPSGFYIDETPLSASAVALNGRTVIDADLFDLNHTEMLRGPQGTLYGAGSMGGTIKLVTNPPKLGTFEGCDRRSTLRKPPAAAPTAAAA